MTTSVSSSGIPLLAKEGWTRHQENIAKHPLQERTGWSLISHILTMHSETWLVSDHPVCAASVASRLFLYGAATPPSARRHLRLSVNIEFHNPFSGSPQIWPAVGPTETRV